MTPGERSIEEMGCDDATAVFVWAKAKGAPPRRRPAPTRKESMKTKRRAARCRLDLARSSNALAWVRGARSQPTVVIGSSPGAQSSRKAVSWTLNRKQSQIDYYVLGVSGRRVTKVTANSDCRATSIVRNSLRCHRSGDPNATREATLLFRRWPWQSAGSVRENHNL